MGDNGKTSIERASKLRTDDNRLAEIAKNEESNIPRSPRPPKRRCCENWTLTLQENERICFYKKNKKKRKRKRGKMISAILARKEGSLYFSR
jgi:hypothetical protein